MGIAGNLKKWAMPKHENVEKTKRKAMPKRPTRKQHYIFIYIYIYVYINIYVYSYILENPYKHIGDYTCKVNNTP